MYRLSPEEQERISLEVRRDYEAAKEEAELIGQKLNEASRKKAEAQVREYYGPKITLRERLKALLKGCR